ncbi:hypothetical protein AB0B45_47555 [Nonomuraea sp. NPDC049152]|uniref:hypothetical protein n=1 Tax=Nonomuraea sp. NPDC049152 TaxID=3154350 RepID=UPI0033F8FC4B
MEDLRPPLRLIGYWSSADTPDWPNPNDWVDLDWDDRERELVAIYLAGGIHAPYATAGPSECRICKQANGSLELTDGTYLWPEGLAHYVRDHSVRLPEVIVQHALKWMDGWMAKTGMWTRHGGGRSATVQCDA